MRVTWRGNDYGVLLLPTWPHTSLGISAHVGSRFAHLTIHTPFGALILGCIGASSRAGRMSKERRFYPPTESDIVHRSVDGRGYVDIHRERIRAHEKHDAKDGSMERKRWDHPIWLPVLVEEVGEVARVLNEDELGNLGAEAIKHLREELVQVGAMTVAWIDAIDAETR